MDANKTNTRYSHRGDKKYIHTYVNIFVLNWLCMYNIPKKILGIKYPYICNHTDFIDHIKTLTCVMTSITMITCVILSVEAVLVDLHKVKHGR